ncbi:MAG: tetratricopeptide repeat protein [Bryobacteraceae bacterium]
MSEEAREGSQSRYIAIHERYVSSLKKAMGNVLKGQVPPLPEVARMLGMKPLSLAAPPMLEAALSYRGSLRFVAFHYSPRYAVPVHSDGGDDLPIPNASDWLNFISHPAVCPALDPYPTLFGRLATTRILTRREFEALEGDQQLPYCDRFHSLLLDREERKFYVSQWQPLKVFLACSEPAGAHHAVANGRLVSKGDEDYTRRAPAQQVEALIAWLDDQLKHPEVQEGLARWHTRYARIEEAFRILRSVAKDHPERRKRPDFQHAMALLFELDQDYDSAIAAFEACAPAWEMDSYDHFNLGMLYLEAKRFSAALDQFRQGRAKETEPGGSERYALEARAYVGRGELDRAVETCKRGLAECGSNDADPGVIHVALADIAALRGDFGGAAAECRAAMLEDYRDGAEFDESIPIFQPAWWLSLEARLANAARCFEAPGKGPFHIHLGRGYLYLGMNRYTDAEEQFALACSIRNSPEASWFRGVSALASKRQERAAGIFQDMAESFTQDERGLAGLALLYAARGANDMAFEYCGKALSINPDSGEVHAVLAYLHWAHGDYQNAAGKAEKAVRAGFRVSRHVIDPPRPDASEHRLLRAGEARASGAEAEM